ncbi:hypothetical protein [Thermus oshimai]|uniref:hypothetical protein n=1 Tax=Thermus oshimai TaxID=56957 RepID=UPI00035CE651|nr:hypothetical protein [Thermus oshimai]
MVLEPEKAQPQDPKARLSLLKDAFGMCFLEDPELFELLPERFVLHVLPLDDEEAGQVALAELPHLRKWSAEGEGPIAKLSPYGLTQALFLGGRLVGVVLPEGKVVPARAA